MDINSSALVLFRLPCHPFHKLVGLAPCSFFHKRTLRTTVCVRFTSATGRNTLPFSPLHNPECSFRPLTRGKVFYEVLPLGDESPLAQRGARGRQRTQSCMNSSTLTRDCDSGTVSVFPGTTIIRVAVNVVGRQTQYATGGAGHYSWCPGGWCPWWGSWHTSWCHRGWHRGPGRSQRGSLEKLVVQESEGKYSSQAWASDFLTTS